MARITIIPSTLAYSCATPGHDGVYDRHEMKSHYASVHQLTNDEAEALLVWSEEQRILVIPEPVAPQEYVQEVKLG